MRLEHQAREVVVFWTSFLRRLVERGLRGVELAISGAQLGAQDAIRSVFYGRFLAFCCGGAFGCIPVRGMER